MINEDHNWLVGGCGIVNIPNEKRMARQNKHPTFKMIYTFLLFFLLTEIINFELAPSIGYPKRHLE